VQSTTPTPTPVVVDTFSNESHKTKSSDDIDQDKMAVLEAMIRLSMAQYKAWKCV